MFEQTLALSTVHPDSRTTEVSNTARYVEHFATLENLAILVLISVSFYVAEFGDTQGHFVLVCRRHLIITFLQIRQLLSKIPLPPPTFICATVAWAQLHLLQKPPQRRTHVPMLSLPNVDALLG